MSETPKFTPGPWCIHPRFPEFVIVEADCKKGIGGSVYPDQAAESYAKIICAPEFSDFPRFHQSRVTSIIERDANANLIAAAPDYYAAIELINGDVCELDGEDTGYVAITIAVYDALMAAHQKAKGPAA